MMRQILVDHARHHTAAKRGGGNKVALEEAAGVTQRPEVDFVALDEGYRLLGRSTEVLPHFR